MKAKFKHIQRVTLASIIFYPITLLTQIYDGPPLIQPAYGIPAEPIFPDKLIRILSYVSLPIVVIVSLIVGLFIFIKRKRR